jgi:hypothetical protein
MKTDDDGDRCEIVNLEYDNKNNGRAANDEDGWLAAAGTHWERWVVGGIEQGTATYGQATAARWHTCGASSVLSLPAY